jgi:virginiamycin B lyase
VIAEFSPPTAGATPLSIVAGPDGNLWFTEHYGYANRIGCITPAGVITEFPIPTPFSNPVAIASGRDGNLWFTESNVSKIGRISPSGTITEFPLSDGGTPQFIVPGLDGNLWFSETQNAIGRITPAGVVSHFKLNASVTSLVAYQNSIWFTDTANNAVGEINTSGAIAEFPIPTANSVPSGIAIGPDGNLWFTEENKSKIGS